MVLKQTVNSVLTQKAKKNSLKNGQICDLKITSVGANQIGIDDSSYSFKIFVPFTSLGQKVKVKIVKIEFKGEKKKKRIKFAIAKTVLSLRSPVEEKSEKMNPLTVGMSASSSQKIKVADIFTLCFNNVGKNLVAAAELGSSEFLPTAQADSNQQKADSFGASYPGNQYKIFILNANLFTNVLSWPANQKAEIQITKVKQTYAFAKLTTKQLQLMESSSDNQTNEMLQKQNDLNSSQKNQTSQNVWKNVTQLSSYKDSAKLNTLVSLTKRSMNLFDKSTHSAQSLQFNTAFSGEKTIELNDFIRQSSYLTLTLPKQSLGTKQKPQQRHYECLPNHVVLKLANTVVFLKLNQGAVLGDRVKIKFIKVLQNVNVCLPTTQQEKSGRKTADLKTSPKTFTSMDYNQTSNKIQRQPWSADQSSTAFLANGKKKFSSWNFFSSAMQNKSNPTSGDGFDDVNLNTNHSATNNQALNGFVENQMLSALGMPARGFEKSGIQQIAYASVIQLNPMAFTTKRLVVKSAVCEMLKSGMHFGEKAIKCNARMKKYVWIRQKGQNKKKPLIKKGCNVVNLLKTRRCLKKALTQLGKYAAKGRTFLFVATKKPAAALIHRASLFSKTSFFVNTRWLGGMLTNCKTISQSISKIRPILKEKQTIIKQILIKRQNLKNRLIEKAILLRKRSQVLLTKARHLWCLWFGLSSTDSSDKKGDLLNQPQLSNQTRNLNINYEFSQSAIQQKNQKLLTRAEQLMEKTQNLLQMRQKLIKKQQQLSLISDLIQEKSLLLTNKFQILCNQVARNGKKITQLKSLLLIAKQIKTVKMSAKDFNQNLVTLNYATFKKISQTPNSGLASAAPVCMPNPPKSILNKIVSAIRSFALSNTQNSKQSFSNSFSGTGPQQNKLLVSGAIPQKVVIVSALLSKFSLFIPYIRESIKTIGTNNVQLIEQIQLLKQSLNTIKQQITSYANLKLQILNELKKIKVCMVMQRTRLSFVKRKLKQQSSMIRLIKFLPKLRYLSTPYSQIYETVQILMKKRIDPKLKYPMNFIYDQKLSLKSKKVIAARKKSWQRLEKYFGGIANMTKMKKNQINKNVAIIIGQQEEQNAVRECKKLGIKMFNMVDTNCNPNYADHFIPANDDSRQSIKYVLTKFLTRIRLAQKIGAKVKIFKRLTA